MTAQDLGAIASEGTLQRIATALEGMSSGGGGGSSAKLYRHDLRIQAVDSGSGVKSIDANLSVYRTTDTALTLADLSDTEIKSANVSEMTFWVYDSNYDETVPKSFVPLGITKVTNSDTQLSVSYITELVNMLSYSVFNPYSEKFTATITDTVTEV